MELPTDGAILVSEDSVEEVEDSVEPDAQQDPADYVEEHLPSDGVVEHPSACVASAEHPSEDNDEGARPQSKMRRHTTVLSNSLRAGPSNTADNMKDVPALAVANPSVSNMSSEYVAQTCSVSLPSRSDVSTSMISDVSIIMLRITINVSINITIIHVIIIIIISSVLVIIVLRAGSIIIRIRIVLTVIIIISTVVIIIITLRRITSP